MPEAIPTIEYRDVQGFPGYKVGNDGSVWSAWNWSILKNDKGKWAGRSYYIGNKWRRLKHRISPYGYLEIEMKKGGCRYYQRIHTLVLLAFVGPRPVGMEGCHEDGDYTNANLDNLRWDTHKNNGADMVRHGRSCKGTKQGRVKLSEQDVFAIRLCLASGEQHSVIAKKFGISPSHVSGIKHGRFWGWLKGE